MLIALSEFKNDVYLVLSTDPLNKYNVSDDLWQSYLHTWTIISAIVNKCHYED